MKKKKIVGILICIVCFILAVATAFMIRTKGSICIHSRSDYTPDKTIYYLQNDPQWRDERLGGSSYTMAGSGCLTTCIASELQMQHIKVSDIQNVAGSDIGQSITPGTLNEFFSEQGVYDAEGNIQWDALEQALDVEVVKLRAGELGNDGLDTLLSQGVFPIAFVRVYGLGSFHFVLITGSKDGEYLCMDPLNEKQDAVPLSRFGDRIFAVRYIIEKDV